MSDGSSRIREGEQMPWETFLRAKGWTLTLLNGHRVWIGKFVVPDQREREWKRWRGVVAEETKAAFIADPPPEVEALWPFAAVRRFRSPWFRLDWAEQPTDPAEAILAVEGILNLTVNAKGRQVESMVKLPIGEAEEIKNVHEALRIYGSLFKDTHRVWRAFLKELGDTIPNADEDEAFAAIERCFIEALRLIDPAPRLERLVGELLERSEEERALWRDFRPSEHLAALVSLYTRYRSDLMPLNIPSLPTVDRLLHGQRQTPDEKSGQRNGSTAGKSAADNAPELKPGEGPHDDGRRVLCLPSEFLLQLQETLFPAERLCLIAGRSNNGETRLTALFDVTGEASSGHVSADPDKLHRALVGMHEAGCGLKIWAHSHPGSGPDSSIWSPRDQDQHRRWLEHYSSELVCMVMVKDGYFRIFGPALDTGMVQIQIAGDCVTEVDDHGYRLILP